PHCLTPRPTPYPYTTLFRSPVHWRDRPPGRGAARSRLASRGLAAYSLRSARHRSPPRVPQRGRPPPGRPEPRPTDRRTALVARPDRKSTRLNSSHVAISYAV